MTSSNQCCGRHVTECARILAIIGVILSILSWNPLSLIIYGCVWYGVETKKSSWLLPAIILLAISVVLIIIAIILIATFVVFAATKHAATLGVGIPVLIMCVILSSYTFFSLFVINNARKAMIEAKTYPMAATTTVHVQAPQSQPTYAPPPPAQTYPQTQGYPSSNPSYSPKTSYPAYPVYPQ